MTEEQVRPSITIHVQGLYPHITSAFGTTIANQLRFAFPLAQVKLKHDHRAGDFVKRDALNFDSLRYDEIEVTVVSGENPVLENIFVQPCKKTQDAFRLMQNPADLLIAAIQKEAEEKAFNVEQNSDNWLKYVPEHLRPGVNVYLTIQQTFISTTMFLTKEKDDVAVA